MKVTGIICFGDSVLAGTGASNRNKGCAKIIKASLNIPISLKAKNWDTSQNALERLDDDVLSNHLSHVLIFFGNNDCWLDKSGMIKISKDQFESNLKAIVSSILKNNQTPVLCTLQPIISETFVSSFPIYAKHIAAMDIGPLEWQSTYNEIILKIANANHLNIVDIRAQFIKKPTVLMSQDGIHPNDEGHQVIADSILEVFKKLDPSIEIARVMSA